MNAYKGDIVKFIKFALTGVLNTAVDSAVFTVVIALGESKYLAQMLGYACGMLCSFLVNRRWTFKSGDGLISPTTVRFVAANLCLMLLSLCAVYVAGDLLGLSTLLTKGAAVCCTVLLGFIVNRIWVFKEQ